MAQPPSTPGERDGQVLKASSCKQLPPFSLILWIKGSDLVSPGQGCIVLPRKRGVGDGAQ